VLRHEALRGFEPAVEIERGDHRLAGIGQRPLGVAAATGHAQMRPQIDGVRHLRQGLAPRQLGEALGQRAFLFVREAAVQDVGQRQAQHPVAEEFKPLVVVEPVLPGRGMRQREGEQSRVGEAVAERFFQRRKWIGSALAPPRHLMPWNSRS
jgi:hypothetical protein